MARYILSNGSEIEDLAERVPFTKSGVSKLDYAAVLRHVGRFLYLGHPPDAKPTVVSCYKSPKRECERERERERVGSLLL